MELGLSTYSYSWAVGTTGFPPARPLNEQDLLDRVRALGLKLLQIGDNLPLHTFAPGRLQALADRARQEGVRLEVGARGLNVARVAKYAAIARQLDAQLLRIVIDEPAFHPSPDTVIGLLRECVPLLEGLTLGIENHDRFPAATIRLMIETVGSDRIGVCLDSSNSLGAGEGIATVVSLLAPITVNLHLKDFVITRVPHLMGFNIEGRPAGQGMLDIGWLLNQFHDQPRCRTAVLELWPPPEAQLEQTIAKEARWVEQSVSFLKPLFA